MINAVMHLLSWGLVIVLVWGHLGAAPAQQKSEFRGVAELGQGTYLVASGAANQFGLLKYDDAGLGFRAIRIDDWEGYLAGQLIGLCAVKGYDGEVVAAIAQPDGQSALVHIQVRNWSKTPRSAILGRALLPQSLALTAFSCGEASQTTMAVSLFSHEQNLSADYVFEGYKLANLKPIDSYPTLLERDLSGAYEDARGRWLAVADAGGPGTVIWSLPFDAEAYPAFRLDGFNVTGIAVGPKGYDISVVTSEPGLGSVWRPLGAALAQ
ncbi:hypothetical protein QWY82_08765 [Simiduia curdlanivorans]|uniref:Phytase-like domain-containing protein n=1 Tax=Simiduia curdlanivorans TaxID=1492769 RepID=A0ABV8V6Q0_9GAMM|nr:hypothetical protein [Simiduia curdlanivorans]MDN3638896.1 hypothetical protein [Simiduia curdlanivorans]